MHELGVVFHIIDLVKEVAAKNNVTQINSVTLEVGEVSGIVPHYFEDVWKWAVNKPDAGPIKGAMVILQRQPAVTLCEDCNKEYATVRFGKICPHCHSEHTHLLRGSGVSIKNIQVLDE